MRVVKLLGVLSFVLLGFLSATAGSALPPDCEDVCQGMEDADRICTCWGNRVGTCEGSCWWVAEDDGELLFADTTSDSDYEPVSHEAGPTMTAADLAADTSPKALPALSSAQVLGAAQSMGIEEGLELEQIFEHCEVEESFCPAGCTCVQIFGTPNCYC